MFLTQINSSLVDSNMLVRCIVLSLDRFESQTKDVKGLTQMTEQLIERWMSVRVLKMFPCLFLSGWSVFRVSPLVLHGSSGKQVVLPFQTVQHHQCPNPHSGKLYDCFVFCVSGVGNLLHDCQRGVITGTWAVAREVYAFYSGVAEVLHTCTMIYILP